MDYVLLGAILLGIVALVVLVEQRAAGRTRGTGETGKGKSTPEGGGGGPG